MNLSREDLIQSEATMNQMRNAVYHLQRFLKLNNVVDVRERLRQMGKNIAYTYMKYWKPIEIVNLSNITKVIATIYRSILDSSVSVELNEQNQTIIVKDNNCALCKYKFDDIDVAGCEVISGMVTEIINQISKETNTSKVLLIEPMDITESFTFGGKYCLQSYNYHIGGV